MKNERRIHNYPDVFFQKCLFSRLQKALNWKTVVSKWEADSTPEMCEQMAE